MLNYEILSIRRKLDASPHLGPGNIHTVTDFHPKIGARLSKFHTNHVSFDGKFNHGRDSIQYILHNFDIYSVKRLSDGKVFTIGDVITSHFIDKNFTGNIDKIIICKNPDSDVVANLSNDSKDKLFFCVMNHNGNVTLDEAVKQQELSYAKQLHDYQRKYNEAIKEMNEHMLSQYPLTVHDAFYLDSPKKLLLLL